MVCDILKNHLHESGIYVFPHKFIRSPHFNLFLPIRYVSGGEDVSENHNRSAGLGVVHGPWESTLRGTRVVFLL